MFYDLYKEVNVQMRLCTNETNLQLYISQISDCIAMKWLTSLLCVSYNLLLIQCYFKNSPQFHCMTRLKVMNLIIQSET